jgi:hypothetical protein
MLLVKKKLNSKDVYVFDCMGLVVIRNAISLSVINHAKKIILEQYPNKPRPWKFATLGLGEVFWDILNNHLMLAIAEQLCGDQFRLDHAFAICSDANIINLHGGPNSSFGSCFSHIDNHLIVGQLACGFPLTAQSPATGGMCYIPGSHKSLDHRSGGEIRKELLQGNLDQECVVVPSLNPGDLVVFSESLVHGDIGWKPPESRITLYYKFAPGFMTWRDARDQEQYMSLARTPLEKRLLEPPWSGNFSDKEVKMDYANQRKGKTLQ